MSTVGFVAAMEQIGLADQSVAAAWQAHVTIGSLPLYLFGNDAQRERWLRPLAEGRVLGAFGLTEPDAGSDARGIRTRAERRDGGWLINGRKTFISNAGTDMSFGVTLLARTESAEEQEPRFASFVVEKDTPGFTMGPKMRGIGWRGLDTRELFFDDVWVPDDHLVGDPDLGLSQFLRTLEVGRISIAALSLSLTQAVLDMATDYARQRVQFGQPISKFQAVQFKLADIATELEAARWLTYRAAYLRDTGQPFLKEAAMAKLKASRVADLGGIGGRPDPRGPRLHARVTGRPLLLRREGARDRRGHQRDPAPGDRSRVGLLSSHGSQAPDGLGDVVAVGEPRPFEVGSIGRGSRRGADPLDRRVEVPEPLAGDRGRDLGADAEGDDRLVGDQESARLVHRVEDRHHVERSHGPQVDHLDGDALAGQALGGGDRLVDHP